MTDTTAETTTLQLPATAIELRPGERYAGPVLDAEGRIQHHLVLLPDWPERRLNWQDAKAWAESLGAQLPTRQEQALLYANCKPHLKRTGDRYELLGHKRDTPGGTQYVVRRSGFAKPTTLHHSCHVEIIKDTP